MKKVIMLLTTLVILLSFSGCASIDYTLILDQDDAVTLEATFLFDDEIYQRLSSEEIEVYRQQLRYFGFDVSYTKVGTDEGVVASIDLESLEQLVQTQAQILPITSLSYGNKQSTFFERYAVDIEIDMTDFVSSIVFLDDIEPTQTPTTTTTEDGEETVDTGISYTYDEIVEIQHEFALRMLLESISASDIDMSLTVQMPQEIISETGVLSEDSTSVTYDVNSAGKTVIHFETTTLRWMPILIVGSIACLFLLLFFKMFFSFLRGRRLVCMQCGHKNDYRWSVCHECGGKLSARRSRACHTQKVICIFSAIIIGFLLVMVQMSRAEATEGSVSMHNVSITDTDLVSVINALIDTQRVVDPSELTSTSDTDTTVDDTADTDDTVDESDTTDDTQTEDSDTSDTDDTEIEDEVVEVVELTSVEKVNILVSVASQQRDALYQYETDDYWDARTYLGSAYDSPESMAGLYQEDDEAINKVFNTYVSAGIIDEDGNVLSLLMGYKPSTQTSPISESDAITNVENYLDNMGLLIPANLEISESDSDTYTVYCYDDGNSNQSWYQVDKYTGQILIVD